MWQVEVTSTLVQGLSGCLEWKKKTAFSQEKFILEKGCLGIHNETRPSSLCTQLLKFLCPYIRLLDKYLGSCWGCWSSLLPFMVFSATAVTVALQNWWCFDDNTSKPAADSRFVLAMYAADTACIADVWRKACMSSPTPTFHNSLAAAPCVLSCCICRRWRSSCTRWQGSFPWRESSSAQQSLQTVAT